MILDKINPLVALDYLAIVFLLFFIIMVGFFIYDSHNTKIKKVKK